NGQHILIGAYRDTVNLMRRLGLEPSRLLHRIPLTVMYPDGFCLRASSLPAPWHLATALFTARGLTLSDRMALVAQLHAWKKASWLVAPNSSALATLTHATPMLIERVFEPLCLAALNVRLAQASGQMFLRILQDSLGRSRHDSELWIPRCDLSALLPDAALKTLTRQGAHLAFHGLATRLTPTASGWSIQTRKGLFEAAHVVLALPPSPARTLLETIGSDVLSEALGQLAAIESAPIATIYLRTHPPTRRLPAPAMALQECPERAHYGQWLFDRGALATHEQGIYSVVISGHGAHLNLSAEALCSAVAKQLRETLDFPAPTASAAIIEKRATILATPQLVRPPTALGLKGLYLAGDAANSPYPSTIEGSVRSGQQAARAAGFGLNRPV
nr:hydroxysqualene dehydroxylase HpnE [Burkholderiaceae bacterium]